MLLLATGAAVAVAWETVLEAGAAEAKGSQSWTAAATAAAAGDSLGGDDAAVRGGSGRRRGARGSGASHACMRGGSQYHPSCM